MIDRSIGGFTVYIGHFSFLTSSRKHETLIIRKVADGGMASKLLPHNAKDFETPASFETEER